MVLIYLDLFLWLEHEICTKDSTAFCREQYKGVWIYSYDLSITSWDWPDRGAGGKILFMTGCLCTWFHQWIYLIWADGSDFDLPMLSVYPFVVIGCEKLYHCRWSQTTEVAKESWIWQNILGYSTLTILSGSAGYEVLVERSRPLRICLCGSIWNHGLQPTWVSRPWWSCKKSSYLCCQSHPLTVMIFFVRIPY